MKSDSGRGRALWLLGLFLLAAGSLVFCLLVIPPWQSPDEPTHFEYARLLSRDSLILYPSADPALQEEIIASCDRHDFWRLVGTPRPPRLPRTFISAPFLCQAPTQIGKNPPGYYLLAALALKLCPSPTLVGQMYWLRSLNAFFSLLTVGAVFLSARRVFGSDFFPALAAAGLIAALPQFAVIGSSVSPDPLANLLAALAILLILAAPVGNRRFFSPVPAVILLGLAVSYKFLIILGAYLLFRLAVLILPGDKSLRRAAVLTLAAEALALCFVYLVLLWFAPRLVGIFLGRIRMLLAAVAGYFQGTGVHSPSYWRWFGAMLFKSFWLYFGWLRYPAPPVVYGAWGGLTALSLFGGAMRLMGGTAEERGGASPPVRGLGILALFAGAALASYYAFWGFRSDYTTTQGRHLFLALPAWAILFVWGLTGLFPVRWGPAVCRGVFLIMPLLAAAAFLGSVLKVY